MEVGQWETASELVDGFIPATVFEGEEGLREATIAAVAIRQATSDPTWSGLNAGRQANLLMVGATCSTVVEALNKIGVKAKFDLSGKARQAQRDEWNQTIVGLPSVVLERWADRRDVIMEFVGYCIASARQSKETKETAPVAQEGMF